MKNKILLLTVIMVLLFTISGCVKEPVVLVDIDFYLFSEKTVIDESQNYTPQIDTLNIYHYINDETGSYVNVEEFANFLSAGLLDYNISKTDTLKLEYIHYFEEDKVEIIGSEFINYYIELDQIENTVYVNDFDLLTRLNFGYSISTNDLVELVAVSQNDVDPQVTIDLDDYGFDVLYENDKYYLPLYLANLLLTGASLNFYEMDEEIILFDYGVDTSLLESYYKTTIVEFDDVAFNTTKYLSLYFDFFYGLKQEKGIDSFSEVIDSYHLNEQSDLEDYYEKLSDFLFELNDLHTRILQTGYLLPEYVPEDNYLYGSKINTFSTASYQNSCSVYDEEFYYELLDESTHLFKIVDFTSNTGPLFADYISMINPDDDVIIDLSCNTGGSLRGVVELMVYLTNENVPIRHLNGLTGRVTEEFYSATTDVAVDANFFVVTSKVTYSAANVFTTIVKDMDVATIIGDESLGGSCALVFTVLPNGVILSNSSYMTFINEDFEIKEDGIEVDIMYQLPYNSNLIMSDIKSFYDIGTLYTFDNIYRADRSRIVFDVIFQDPVIDVNYYVLNIYDEFGTLLYTEEYPNEFVDIHTFDELQDAYDIEVIANYSYNDILFDEVIYYQIVR